LECWCSAIRSFAFWSGLPNALACSLEKVL